MTNIIVAMISEFHLTSSCLPPGHCRPVLPSFVEDELPLLEEYLSESEKNTSDARILNGAELKRLAVWLHCLEMTAFHGEERSHSIQEQDHDDCDLVKFLLDVGTCPFKEADVIARVVAENVERVHGSLRKAQRSLERAECTLNGLIEKERYAEMELGNIPEGHPSRGAKSDELLQIRSQMERNRATIDKHSGAIDSLNDQLVLAGLKTPPDTSDEDEDSEEASATDDSSEAEMSTREVEEDPGVEGETGGENPAPMEDAEVVASEEQADGEEIDDGSITEAENALLDNPPVPLAEEFVNMDSGSAEPTGPESRAVSVEDRQA